MQFILKSLRLAGVMVLACNSTAPVQDATSDAKIHVETVVSGLDNPVHLTAPAGDARLFIVEQPGVIRMLKDGKLTGAPFLDIRTKVKSGGEQGLLSLAFHPKYTTNGYFYVDYTDVNGDTRVERYHVSNNPDSADPASAKLILTVDQPYSNHNGGHIFFGPDNMLYIGMGDGGAGGDPNGNGQNRATLLGALLRIDVDGGDPYLIPADNPYAGQSQFRGEIWAWGLRNPWRSAFDKTTGQLYIADVGQNKWEEINVVPVSSKGLNFGWNVMEGKHCYSSSTCSPAGLTLPVLEYDHSDGCSVTGGVVYRGQIAAIQGHYFYSDYCEGFIRSFKYVNGEATNPQTWNFGSLSNITSFGEDGSGEMYIVSGAGKVYKVVN